MDPVTAGILGGSNIAGGILSGAQNQKATKESTNIEQLLGQRGLDVQSAAVGDQIRRQLETMPLRDRLLAQLQARMGQSPAKFNAGGMWGNAAEPTSTGGLDTRALQQAAASYQPGQGGTRPDIAAQFMNRLGYTPTGNAGFGGPGGNDWQKSLGQQYSSAPQSWANTLVSTGSGNFNTDPLAWRAASGPGAWDPNSGVTGVPGQSQGAQSFASRGLQPNGQPQPPQQQPGSPQASGGFMKNNYQKLGGQPAFMNSIFNKLGG
jgi:hypothetical protein